MQESLWIGAGALLVLALASGLAERRAVRRADPDLVGLMPWTLVQFLCLLGALLVATVAMHS
jgi:hypothetical protein